MLLRMGIILSLVLNVKSVLLTYAQCDKPKEWLMEFLIVPKTGFALLYEFSESFPNFVLNNSV